MKFATRLMAVLALLLLTASTSFARCNPVPTVTFATDGTPEGTFAVIDWEDCDGSLWEVCRKPPRFLPGFGQIPIVDCDIVDHSFYMVEYGEATHFVVKWLDGVNHVGETYLVDFDWPQF